MKVSNKAAFRPYVDILLDRLAQHPGRTVLRYLDEDVTAGAFRASVYRYARALQSMRIGRGAFVAMFCSEYANYITGQSLVIDGGATTSTF